MNYTIDENGILSEPIVMQQGQALALPLPGSAGSDCLDIQDDYTGQVAPSYYGSLNNGATFEPLGAEFMQRLQMSPVDMILRIDYLQAEKDAQLTITAIKYSNEVHETEASNAVDHYAYDATVRAIDEEELKSAVKNNMHELSKGALDVAGWPVTYYKATSLKNIDVLNAKELKSIKDAKTISVLFPHHQMIGQLDFDQWGLQYDELTTIHVVADDFHREFGDEYARPNKSDIIYIGFLDQFFEVTEVIDNKTPTNSILYYELTLKFINDRYNVAKAEDILDLSSMVDGQSQEDMLAEKGQEPQSTDEAIEFPERTWKLQTFKLAKPYTLTVGDRPTYAICYYEDDWKRLRYDNAVLVISELDGTNEVEVQLDDVMLVYAAKLASFNDSLTTFNRNLYYTSYSIPRTLRPIDLIELQTEAK